MTIRIETKHRGETKVADDKWTGPEQKHLSHTDAVQSNKTDWGFAVILMDTRTHIHRRHPRPAARLWSNLNPFFKFCYKYFL